MSQATLGKGTIEYVNSGCGFITTEDAVQDVLFLQENVNGSVPDIGEEVRFEIVQTTHGPRAMDIQRA